MGELLPDSTACVRQPCRCPHRRCTLHHTEGYLREWRGAPLPHICPDFDQGRPGFVAMTVPSLIYRARLSEPRSICYTGPCTAITDLRIQQPRLSRKRETSTHGIAS